MLSIIDLNGEIFQRLLFAGDLPNKGIEKRPGPFAVNGLWPYISALDVNDSVSYPQVPGSEEPRDPATVFGNAARAVWIVCRVMPSGSGVVTTDPEVANCMLDPDIRT
jgi:hypothetical protein